MNNALHTYSTTMPISNYNESALARQNIDIPEDDKIIVGVTQHECAINTNVKIFNFSVITSDTDNYGYTYKTYSPDIINENHQWNLIIGQFEDNIHLGLDFNQPNYGSLYQKILDQIDELLTKEYDWDDIGYEKPYPKDIDYAKRIMLDFISSISSAGHSLYSLEAPFISNGENGGATIEWRESGRSLYFDIIHQNAKFTKVWREGKNTIVRTDKFHKADYVKVWEWIINEQS